MTAGRTAQEQEIPLLCLYGNRNLSRIIRSGGAMSCARASDSSEVCDRLIRNGRTDAGNASLGTLEASAGREPVGVELGPFGSLAVWE